MILNYIRGYLSISDIEDTMERAKMGREVSTPSIMEANSTSSTKGLLIKNKTMLLIVLLQFFWFFILGGVFSGYIDSQKSLSSVKDKLEQLEKKLNPLMAQFSRLEDSMKTANQLSPRESSAVKGFITPSSLPKNELSDSMTTVNQLAHQGSSSTAEIKTSPFLPPREMPRHAEQYHRVERGETLYRISKRYGIAVEEICRLNNLKQGQTIQSGQKLLVTPLR